MRLRSDHRFLDTRMHIEPRALARDLGIASVLPVERKSYSRINNRHLTSEGEKDVADHSHHFAFGVWIWRLSSWSGYRVLRRRRNQSHPAHRHHPPSVESDLIGRAKSAPNILDHLRLTGVITPSIEQNEQCWAGDFSFRCSSSVRIHVDAVP
jgi:hypothetical protein